MTLIGIELISTEKCASPGRGFSREIWRVRSGFFAFRGRSALGLFVGACAWVPVGGGRWTCLVGLAGVSVGVPVGLGMGAGVTVVVV